MLTWWCGSPIGVGKSGPGVKLACSWKRNTLERRRTRRLGRLSDTRAVGVLPNLVVVGGSSRQFGCLSLLLGKNGFLFFPLASLSSDFLLSLGTLGTKVGQCEPLITAGGAGSLIRR